MTGVFIDASALVAVLSGELEEARVSAAIAAAREPFTTAVAMLEATLALARPEKWDLPVTKVEAVLSEYIQELGIALRDLPEAAITARLAAHAASQYRQGRQRLNVCDCLHYATARHYQAAMLATADEFRFTDLDVIP